MATDLTDGTNKAIARSVFVSGSDIYIAGNEYNGTKNVAKIWKNGESTSLTDGTMDGIAYSVYVSGNDVYVAGYESNGTHDVAKLWKNGIKTNLADGNSWAYGVFVK